MNDYILDIRDLKIEYMIGSNSLEAVNGLNLKIKKGENVGIIGESGSGKTSLAMAIMGLIKAPNKVEGNIYYKDLDLKLLNKKDLNKIRWDKISIVFQNSLDVLNPLMTVEEQILEVLVKDKNVDPSKAGKRVEKLLSRVGLKESIKEYYPHQLSGGMRQKVLIAMGIACEPELLIVDEPTSALDIISKSEIIKLLKDLQNENDMTLLLISHELDTIFELTDRVNVMYGGNIVEKGLTKDLIENPKHVYTRGLISSSPYLDPFGDMWGIPGEYCIEDEGCVFEKRCVQSIDKCKKTRPKLEEVSPGRYVSCNRGGIVEILNAKDINKIYKNKKNEVRACIDCSLKINSGEIVSLIGESGSGKTSLASIISGLLKADSGEVRFEGEEVKGNNFTRVKNGMQMVFQDPYSSINENLTIKEAVSEPLEIIGDIENLDDKVSSALASVRFTCDKDSLNRKCYSLSGGQRQRVALARSLIMKPKLLIADEISSMLDLSTQANILRLLKGLQNEMGFSMLYITHDLAVARKISNKVYIMKDGHIVEYGPKSKVFTSPQDNYTKEIITKALS